MCLHKFLRGMHIDIKKYRSKSVLYEKGGKFSRFCILISRKFSSDDIRHPEQTCLQVLLPQVCRKANQTQYTSRIVHSHGPETRMPGEMSRRDVSCLERIMSNLICSPLRSCKIDEQTYPARTTYTQPLAPQI